MIEMEVPMTTKTFLSARLVIGMLVCSTVACGHSSAPLETLRPCEGPLTVTVSSGMPPSISWTPRCAVNRVLVDDPTLGVDRFPSNWGVTLTTGQFGPPVEYGIAPDGASTIEPPRPLEVGRTYRVTVLRADGTTALSSGSATFTP
jgi:hypothetical protein